MNSQRSGDVSRSWLLVAALLLGLAAGLWLRPPSALLRTLTPDGALDPSTAVFIDSWRLLILFAGLIAAGCGISGRLRHVLSGAWQEPAVPSAQTRWIPAIAVVAGAARLVLGHFSDIGLGDDGARVVWLERWLQDPRPIWSGYWAPGHLYLQAALGLLTRDTVRAGILLSALASSATVWILGNATTRVWGATAGVLAAIWIAFAPVSLAYGATPDVNPVFAGLVVACIAAVLRSKQQRGATWLVLAWVCFFFAAWSRFEAFALVPGIALLLWPRRAVVAAFGVALLAAGVSWIVSDSIATGRAVRVVGVVRQDPGLVASRVSSVFSFAGAMWQSLTPPGVLLGLAGIRRALRARAGFAWLPVAVLHVAVLGAAMWTSGTGTQARYFILAAAILSMYAAAALAGILRRSHRIGAACVLLTGVAIAWTPTLFPQGSDLWIRRDPRLRALVDHVASQVAPEEHVLWLANEASYFYPSRTRIAIQRFHGMGRSDDDPRLIVRELESAAATGAVACVQQVPVALQQWETLRGELAADSVELAPPADGYRLYRLQFTRR